LLCRSGALNRNTTIGPAIERFDTALHELENAASLPGELAGWRKNIVAALNRLSQLWSDYLDRHGATFNAIAGQAPGLAHRTTVLREKDAQLANRLRRLREQACGIADVIAERDGSWEPRQRGSALRRELLTFVVDVRAQRAQIDNWFVEALYRDCGVAD